MLRVPRGGTHAVARAAARGADLTARVRAVATRISRVELAEAGAAVARRPEAARCAEVRRIEGNRARARARVAHEARDRALRVVRARRRAVHAAREAAHLAAGVLRAAVRVRRAAIRADAAAAEERGQTGVAHGAALVRHGVAAAAETRAARPAGAVLGLTRAARRALAVVRAGAADHRAGREARTRAEIAAGGIALLARRAVARVRAAAHADVGAEADAARAAVALSALAHPGGRIALLEAERLAHADLDAGRAGGAARGVCRIADGRAVAAREEARLVRDARVGRAGAVTRRRAGGADVARQTRGVRLGRRVGEPSAVEVDHDRARIERSRVLVGGVGRAAAGQGRSNAEGQRCRTKERHGASRRART
jgi:hypothetical protein